MVWSQKHAGQLDWRLLRLLFQPHIEGNECFIYEIPLQLLCNQTGFVFYQLHNSFSAVFTANRSHGDFYEIMNFHAGM